MGSLRKLKCLIAFLIVAIALANDSLIAQRLDTCLLRRSFRCESNKPPVLEKVAFRSLPFANPIAIDVPASGRGLLSVIVSQEAVSTSLHQTINKVINNSKKDATKSLNPFFYSDATPNAILVFRESEVTVFPRVLLVHPEIRNALILPGDRIATFELKSFSHIPLSEFPKEESKDEKSGLNQLQSLNRQDSIHRWYSSVVSSPKPDESISVFSTGLSDSPISGRRRETFENDLNDFMFDLDASDEIIQDLGKVFQTIPLVVELRRNIGGYTFRQIVPLESASLGMTSRNYQVVYQHDDEGERNFKVDDQKWEKMFDAFTRIRLKDGDIVNVVPLYRVPLFFRRGL